MTMSYQNLNKNLANNQSENLNEKKRPTEKQNMHFGVENTEITL